MLQTVARRVTDRFAAPGPVNSKMRLRPPLTVNLRISHRIRSLEATHGGSSPSRCTPTTIGVGTRSGSPAMASATSSPPAPIAIDPHAPEVGVCESAPSRVAPGRANRSVWTWWQIPLPARENLMPYLDAKVCRNRWSSALRWSNCSILWSTYCMARSTFTSWSPSASNSMQAMVPVASCSSVWSILRAISSPGARRPSTRCASRILPVMVPSMLASRVSGVRPEMPVAGAGSSAERDARRSDAAGEQTWACTSALDHPGSVSWPPARPYAFGYDAHATVPPQRPGGRRFPRRRDLPPPHLERHDARVTASARSNWSSQLGQQVREELRRICEAHWCDPGCGLLHEFKLHERVSATYPGCWGSNDKGPPAVSPGAVCWRMFAGSV